MVGMTCYIVGLLLLIPVKRELDLILPAIVAGMGHCFSYPFLVDLAAERMPIAHRGAATAIVLGATDVGFLLAFLIEGALIERYGFNTTLVAVATTCAIGMVYYAARQRGDVARRRNRGSLQ
jgi:predicted MFS family arabinose efflux permease